MREQGEFIFFDLKQRLKQQHPGGFWDQNKLKVQALLPTTTHVIRTKKKATLTLAEKTVHGVEFTTIHCCDLRRVADITHHPLVSKSFEQNANNPLSYVNTRFAEAKLFT